MKQRWTTTKEGLPKTVLRVWLPAHDTLKGAYKGHPSSPPEHSHLYQVCSCVLPTRRSITLIERRCSLCRLLLHPRPPCMPSRSDCGAIKDYTDKRVFCWQSSKFTATRGQVAYVLDGKEGLLTAGQSVTLPPHHPHTFWNAKPAEEVEIQVKLPCSTPCLSFA